MKKLFFILLIVFFIGYIDIDNKGGYLNDTVLNYNIEKTVFKSAKAIGISIYQDIITEDFKDCTKLAVDNTFNAVKILFVNVVDTALGM